MLNIPKPSFADCDETSLSLQWEKIDSLLPDSVIKLQYKESHIDWMNAAEVVVSNSSTVNGQQQVKLTDAEVVDLKPGTPYFVRLAVMQPDGQAVYGPETVFDTKPIDCGPKGKKSGCTIC